MKLRENLLTISVSAVWVWFIKSCSSIWELTDIYFPSWNIFWFLKFFSEPVHQKLEDLKPFPGSWTSNPFWEQDRKWWPGQWKIDSGTQNFPDYKSPPRFSIFWNIYSKNKRHSQLTAYSEDISNSYFSNQFCGNSAFLLFLGESSFFAGVFKFTFVLIRPDTFTNKDGIKTELEIKR